MGRISVEWHATGALPRTRSLFGKMTAAALPWRAILHFRVEV